jgi:hypothetical protein
MLESTPGRWVNGPPRIAAQTILRRTHLQPVQDAFHLIDFPTLRLDDRDVGGRAIAKVRLLADTCRML